MRITTWNINGVRTLPQYHPWNTLKTFDDILNHLEADIICFQEMKSSRQGLPKAVALPPSYDSFFSFPVKKSGYSGIAIYTRRNLVVPLKAEEGLTGLLQPRPPLTPEERISRLGNYPPDMPIPADQDEPDYKDLDSEGRAVIVDLGLFVLISVYCPNDGTGTEERDKFKMDYHRLLESRVRTLIREGREVVVVGDLNACAAVEDHCEGELMVARGLAEGLEGEEGFWGKDYRRWIRDWLIKEDGTGGCMVDIVRKFWPDRKGMYTCWNTKISARDTNYGTRIDFILITPGLVPWVKAADIQPQIKGSDHCPVFVDLFDEITKADGHIVRLRDVLGSRAADGTPPEPPRLAAKFWDEHKQKLLSNFFGKKTDAHEPVPSSSIRIPSSAIEPQPSQTSSTGSQPPVCDSNPPTPPDVELLDPVSSPPDPSASTAKRKLTVDHIPSATKKLKPSQPQKESAKGKLKLQSKSSQSSIARFFSQPKPSSSKSTTSSSVPPSNARAQPKTSASSSPPLPPASQSQTNSTEADEDADYQLALQLSQAENAQAPRTSQEKDPGESKQAWNTLLAPTQIPLCTMHREPAKEYTVNKPGPNKGKKFFICSRPVGPGYDKGSERPRDQVDPRYKCNFFKWSSEVRKEMARNGKA